MTPWYFTTTKTLPRTSRNWRPNGRSRMMAWPTPLRSAMVWRSMKVENWPHQMWLTPSNAVCSQVVKVALPRSGWCLSRFSGLVSKTSPCSLILKAILWVIAKPSALLIQPRWWMPAKEWNLRSWPMMPLAQSPSPLPNPGDRSLPVLLLAGVPLWIKNGLWRTAAGMIPVTPGRISTASMLRALPLLHLPTVPVPSNWITGRKAKSSSLCATRITGAPSPCGKAVLRVRQPLSVWWSSMWMSSARALPRSRPAILINWWLAHQPTIHRLTRWLVRSASTTPKQTLSTPVSLWGMALDPPAFTGICPRSPTPMRSSTSTSPATNTSVLGSCMATASRLISSAMSTFAKPSTIASIGISTLMML